MARFTEKIQKKLFALRKRAEVTGDRSLSSAIDRVVWHSFPVVFTDYFADARELADKRFALYQRRMRHTKYLLGLAANSRYVYFLTLTFDDHYLESLSTDTRYRYVKKFLNSSFDDWFACEDFGKLNGRPHFHCFVGLDYPLSVSHVNKRGKVYYALKSVDSWPYGFYSVLALSLDYGDLKKSLGYAFKASNYAFKACIDSSVRPFHKRGCEHSWVFLLDDRLL